MKAAAHGDRQAFEQVEAAILKGLPRMTEGRTPSTGQDIVKGRRTEIDFINGLVADKGDEAGIRPRALVEVVKQVERKEVEPDPSLVHRVWKLAGMEPMPVAPAASAFNVGNALQLGEGHARVDTSLPFAGGGWGGGTRLKRSSPPQSFPPGGGTTGGIPSMLWRDRRCLIM